MIKFKGTKGEWFLCETQNLRPNHVAIKNNKNSRLICLISEPKNIEIAEFDELPAIKFEEAMKGNIVAQKKVTKKENCVYISALNKKNVLKILKRDFGIACL